MKFGSGKSWASQSTPEMKLQAAKAFAKSPPAIVQPAEMTPGQFKAEVKVCVHMWSQYTDRLLELYETFIKRWEEFGKTRDLAAEDVFGTSWHAVKQRIIRLHDKLTVEVSSVSCVPDADEKALSEVEKAHEIEEKPAVHAATPEQMAKPKAKPDPEPEAESAKPPMDASGAVIPQHLLPLRDRRQEVTDAEYHASKLGALLENLQSNGKDPLWAHLMATGSLQTYAHSAKTIRHNLAECLPDVVCPQCEGEGKTKPQANAFVTCSYCCGSGWISEVRWNRDYVKSHDSQKLATVAKRNGKA